MLWTRLAQATAAISIALLGAGAAPAETPEEFYTGKTVKLIISAAPGGASDFFGRQFAPYLAKHIPGHPEVIVENVAGASGMAAALQLQEKEPRDGTSLALLQRNNFYVSLIDPSLKFDPQKANWLGSLNKEYYTIIVNADAPVYSVDDLFSQKLSLGATSFANENRTYAVLTNDYLGTQFDIVLGYDGNASMVRALEQGELQSKFQTTQTLTAGNEAQLLADGKIRIIAQLGVWDAPDFPDLPNLYERFTDPEAKAVADFLLKPLAAGRPFAMPPEVPADRVAAMRAAFDAAAADPEFLAEMAKLNSAVEAINGDELTDIIAGIWASPPNVLAKITEMLTPQ